jgi:nitrogen regulatory protein PII
MIDIVVKDDEVPTIKKTHLLKAPEPVISVTEKSLLQCEDVIRIRKGEEGNEAL